MAFTHEPVDLDPLFDSVETELVRRWVYHDLPNELACRPASSLRTTVTLWWQLYQESNCAVQGINRTQWNRPLADSPPTLDTLALLASLKEAHRVIHVSALLSFRPLSQTEQKALLTLEGLQLFFDLPIANKFRKWLHLL